MSGVFCLPPNFALVGTKMRKQLSIGGDVARRFFELLDPDHDEFFFATGDDNEERAKEARNAKKPAWVDHRRGSMDAQLAWLNQQSATAGSVRPIKTSIAK